MKTAVPPVLTPVPVPVPTVATLTVAAVVSFGNRGEYEILVTETGTPLGRDVWSIAVPSTLKVIGPEGTVRSMVTTGAAIWMVEAVVLLLSIGICSTPWLPAVVVPSTVRPVPVVAVPSWMLPEVTVTVGVVSKVTPTGATTSR